MSDVQTLWRPTGPRELALVEEAGWRRWPPRLPDQPIFYPVLNEDYATRIARDWNVKASGAGYVTRFDVRTSYLDSYEVQQAGGRFETRLEGWLLLGLYGLYLVEQVLAATAGGNVAVQPSIPASCQKRCQSCRARLSGGLGSGGGAAGGVTAPR